MCSNKQPVHAYSAETIPKEPGKQEMYTDKMLMQIAVMTMCVRSADLQKWIPRMPGCKNAAFASHMVAFN